MKRYIKSNRSEEPEEHNLRVCEHCLMGIESHEGSQYTKAIFVDENDPEESKCEWCEENGFDTLYEFV